MTPQQLIGLGLRLLSVWLCIASISYFTSIPAAIQASNLHTSPTLAYAIGAAHLVAAVVLWFFPMLFAAILLPRTRAREHATTPGS